MADLPTCWRTACTAEVAGLYRLTNTGNTEWCCVEHSRGHAWIEGLPVAQPTRDPTTAAAQALLDAEDGAATTDDIPPWHAYDGCMACRAATRIIRQSTRTQTEVQR
jgi:hypothetical protein